MCSFTILKKIESHVWRCHNYHLSSIAPYIPHLKKNHHNFSNSTPPPPRYANPSPLYNVQYMHTNKQKFSSAISQLHMDTPLVAPTIANPRNNNKNISEFWCTHIDTDEFRMNEWIFRLDGTRLPSHRICICL